MKRIFIAITCIAFYALNLNAQTQKVFKIDYHGLVQDQNIDQIDTSIEYAMRAWVNAEYIKLSPQDVDNGIEIINKKTSKSFLLFPALEQYHVTNDGTEMDDSEDTGINVELIAGKSKNIAGYDCKLALIKTDFNVEDMENYVIEIWYTEKIPSIYWNQFSFLKQIPGAVLQVSLDGNGFIATDIAQETLKDNEFSIPENYTEYEVETGEIYNEDDSLELEETNQEEMPVDEDRFLYYDGTETYLGLKDENDNIITKPIYSYFDYFRGGISTVINDDSKFGSMDKNGNIKIPFKYDFLAYDDEYQQYIYAEGEKFGILSANDKPIIKAEYDMVSHMNDGYIAAQLNDKTGIIDSKGNIIVPISYPIIIEFNDQVFVSAIDDSYVLFSIKENKKISEGFDLISLSKDSIHLVQKGEKYGYINNEGKIVIPIKYSIATSFEDGVASVADSEDSDVYGINTKGEIVETN